MLSSRDASGDHKRNGKENGRAMSLSSSSMLKTLNPEWQSLEPHFAPLKNIENVSIQDVRNGLYALIRAFDEAVPTITEGLTVQEQEIVAEDGATIKLRIYIPHTMKDEEKGGFPLLCWHFGGGFVSGTLDDDDKRLRRLATERRLVCTSVGYRLAPEHGYPTPVNDAFCALKWVLSNIMTLSIDVHKGILIGGFSAGANITCAVIQRALKDSSIRPLIIGQVLISPSVVAPPVLPDKWKDELISLEEFAEGPVLSKAHMQMFYNLYAGTDPATLSNTEVSPLLMSSFTGLPPTYMQVCGCDIVRDEGLLYHKLLEKAGVPTKIQIYPDLPHGFQTFTPQFSKSWEQDKNFHDGISWLLNHKRHTQTWSTNLLIRFWQTVRRSRAMESIDSRLKSRKPNEAFIVTTL